MNKGDIVLIPFPFTNLSQTKLRPAVILWVDPTGNDVTLCFISSRGVDSLYEGEFGLNPSDEEFKSTGLKAASKVRVTRIVTIERSLIARRLGQLGNRQIQQLNSALLQAFKLSDSP